MAIDRPDAFDHPTWTAAVGIVVAYGVILLVMFGLLFLLPTLVFRALGV